MQRGTGRMLIRRRRYQVGPTAYTWSVDPALQLIRLNEILADSVSAPDQVELYNAGSAPVDLSGWSLTDSSSSPGKFVLPPGSTIAAGGYLVLTPPATALQFDKDGETISLYDNGTTPVLRDRVSFGHQIADLTIGRIGPSGAWELGQITLGTENQVQRTGDRSSLRINEWFASGAARYDNDWIELSNGSSLPLPRRHVPDGYSKRIACIPFRPTSFVCGSKRFREIRRRRSAVQRSHTSRLFTGR